MDVADKREKRIVMSAELSHSPPGGLPEKIGALWVVLTRLYVT